MGRLYADWRGQSSELPLAEKNGHSGIALSSQSRWTRNHWQYLANSPDPLIQTDDPDQARTHFSTWKYGREICLDKSNSVESEVGSSRQDAVTIARRSQTICAVCGTQMQQVDMSSFTGRAIREYSCPKCGHTSIEDCGEALWQTLHNAREKEPGPAIFSSGPRKQRSLLGRLWARIRNGS